MDEIQRSIAEASDADLIEAVRAGHTIAYQELFERHRTAATRLARQLVPANDADDLVSEAFTRVLSLLMAGKGPHEFFRAYLLTSIRRLHVDKIRAGKRVRSTDDEAELDRTIDFVDPSQTQFEHRAAAKAFTSLPERWQMVLWHLDVEGQKPADLVPLMGMSANSISALAYRAREGLRQAYLQGHLAATAPDECRQTTSLLGAYVRSSASKRDAAMVKGHLDECSRCAGLYLELTEVNRNLSALVGPALLGAAAFSGYVAAGSTAAAIGIKALAANLAKMWLEPVKSAGSTIAGSGAQAAVAATVIAGVAAAATIAATRDGSAPTAAPDQPGGPTVLAEPNQRFAPRPSSSRQLSAEPSADPSPASMIVLPDLLTPSPTLSRPGPGSSTSARPTEHGAPQRPTASTPRPASPHATSPAPSPTTPAPTKTVPTAADPTSPSPTRTTPPPAPTDYSVSAPSIASDSTLFQRRISIPVAGHGDDRASAERVEVTIKFSQPVTFRGVASSGWDCGSATRNHALSTLRCTQAVGPSDRTSLVVKAIGLVVAGTISVDAPGDPNRSNNSTSFRAGAYLGP